MNELAVIGTMINIEWYTKNVKTNILMDGSWI